jgi:hypothetical protein
MTKLNIKVPLSSVVHNYDPEEAKAKYAANAQLIADKYHYEKIMGKRRSDGALKLKELKPEHKQYVACYINGMKGVEIAEQFDVAAITVYRVLADPLALNLIGEFDEGFKREFKSMFPLVADAVRTGLDSGSTKTKLQAVDRWTKVCRFLDGDEEEKDQEEKTIAVRAARMRFVDLVKDATKGQKLLEAEFIEVTSS